jgi:hypothetical protein
MRSLPYAAWIGVFENGQRRRVVREGGDFQITFREVKEVDKTTRGKHRWLVSQLPESGIASRYCGVSGIRSNPACCSYLPRRMSRPAGTLVADFSGIAWNSWPGCNSLPPPFMSLPSRTKTSST